MLSRATTWRRNAMSIDMVGIMTSLHPMYNRTITCGRKILNLSGTTSLQLAQLSRS